MNQAYLLLLSVTSDLFLLVSIVRSLKCCYQRRSALMVSNEVSTRVDLYNSCLRFCKWAGIALPTFYSSVVLTVGIPADLIFRLGWDTSRCHFLCLLIRGWDWILQPILSFAVDWILQPILFNYSSPVFSCLGQLRRILSSKPLINRHSRRRRSWAPLTGRWRRRLLGCGRRRKKHVIMGSGNFMPFNACNGR